MPSRTPLFLTCLLLCATALPGCTGGRLVDPAETYRTMRSQDYSFLLVFEASIETLRELDFQVASQQKDSNERRATIISTMKINPPVKFTGVETGERLHVEIRAGKGSAHGVRLAASRWQRNVDTAAGTGYWRFVGTAPLLHDQFSKIIEQRFRIRYELGKD
jgi:hypothetical protein